MALRTLRLPSSIRLDANGASIVPSPAGRLDISPAAGQNVNIDDDVLFTLGTDDDQVLLNRSTALGVNTALTGVLVGTPVTPAIAANSLIISNITASGDVLIAANRGGNSENYLFVDASAGTLTLYAPNGAITLTPATGSGVIGPDGTDAAPGFVFINDTTTGIRRIAGIGMGLVVGGGTTGAFTSTVLRMAGNAITWGTAIADTPDVSINRGAADRLDLASGDSFQIVSGILHFGDTANANMTIGININQGANDNQLLAGKSSDVAHGLTSAGTVAAETDDYFTVQKFSATLGGVLLASFAEDPAGVQVAMSIDAFGGQAATAPSTTNENLVIIRAAEHDGANALVNAPANSQIFGIQRRVAGAWNNAFIVDAEGDLFVDGSTTITAFDDWDDVALVRAFDRERTPERVIRSVWDDHVRYNRKDLQRAGILSRPSDAGRPMVNVTQLQRLHNGALWQLGTRVMQLEEKNVLLEQTLEALGAGR